MISINNLFNALLDNRITESFSWENFLTLLVIFILFYFFIKCILDCVIILNKNVSRIICVIVSLFITITVGIRANVLNNHFVPVDSDYATTQPVKAHQAITDINKDYPYFLKVSPSRNLFSNNINNSNEYFVFSKSTNQVENVYNTLTNTNWSSDDNLVFLHPDKSTIIVKATYNTKTNAIEKYKIMKNSVGLTIKNWDASYKNTSRINLNDFKLDDDNNN